MKSASDFRRIARDALSGRWLIAVLAGFIAALLGGTGSVNFSVNLPTEDLAQSPEYTQILQQLLPLFIILAGIVLIIAIVLLVVGSFVKVGYARFNLELLKSRETPDISLLFHYARYLGNMLVATLLPALYIFLWTLAIAIVTVVSVFLNIPPFLGYLGVIPIILITYNYAMVPYILAEDPTLRATQALERSKAMMYGHRFRLFCLELSFIGWSLLCVLTLGIGTLWLVPYIEAALAAFYKEISTPTIPAEEE